MNKRFSFLCKTLMIAGLVSAATANADSLWQEEGSQSLYADKRAASVGDIITIIVQENNTATKDSSTKTAKSSSADVGISTFLYGAGAGSLLARGGQMPAMKYASKTGFDGGGTINNSEQITARIAVRVIDVLPNKNLVIEGTRQTAFGGEVQDAILRGVVRTEDIAANNTVFSYNIADATVRFVSKGTITDSSKKGWFSKIFEKVNPL